MAREIDVKDTLLDYLHRAKDLANEYWWDPADIEDIYDMIDSLKESFEINQPDVIPNDEVKVIS